MKFSQRIGITPKIKSLQLDGIDTDLMNSLWNIVTVYILNNVTKKEYSYSRPDFPNFCTSLWHSFFKLTIDSIPEYQYLSIEFIRNKFFSSTWYEVYDFIEFLSTMEFNSIDRNEFIRVVNHALEKEFSGYRFIDGVIAPISNTLEVEEIEQALNQTTLFTSLEGANIHLSAALTKLSDRRSPDFRNSIKESISSIETACRVLTGESTLGKALNSLESNGFNIDQQLKSGFEKIYAYTNDKRSGIRHAIIESHQNPDFDDAKYMLVICSSFINYLIGKVKTHKIKIV